VLKTNERTNERTECEWAAVENENGGTERNSSRRTVSMMERYGRSTNDDDTGKNDNIIRKRKTWRMFIGRNERKSTYDRHAVVAILGSLLLVVGGGVHYL